MPTQGQTAKVSYASGRFVIVRGILRVVPGEVSDLEQRIRQVIQAHGRLPVDLGTLDNDADLFQAGMTSHASVNLMLGLEAEFDVEFPDAMLKRSVFQSVSAIAAALGQLRSAAA
jgi:acyl carrier protein